MKRGKGAYLYDYDENRFVDFELQEGALIHGHASPRLTSVIKSCLGRAYLKGFYSSMHRSLSKTVNDILYAESDLKPTLFYMDSVCEALGILPTILYGISSKGRGVYISSRSTNHKPLYLSLYYHNLIPLSFADVKDLNWKDIDYAVVCIDGKVQQDVALRTLKLLRDNDTICIGDAALVCSFMHLRRLADWYNRFDALLFGDWLTSGLSLYAVAVHDASLLHAQIDDVVQIVQATSAVFKLKTAQKSLHLLGKNGGLEQLLDKHRRFFTALDKKYFQLTGELVCFRDEKRLSNTYADLRTQLFRAGFIFPHSCKTSLSLSFAHSDDLLNRCALRINEVLRLFYR
jgi:glutamate-1-semialdehyde aminotransferase